MIELPLGKIRAFVAALGTDFEVDVDMLRDALVDAITPNKSSKKLA